MNLGDLGVIAGVASLQTIQFNQPQNTFAASPRFSSMAALSGISNEVGLRLLLCPLGSNIVIRTACCTVGIAVPVYSTFKAIEKKDHEEQERWLLYWSAYGSLSLIEKFSDKLLSWVPCYYHFKFALLVWLQCRSGNGSRHLYSRHIRPFLLRYQNDLDKILRAISVQMEKFMSSHQEEINFMKVLSMKCAVTVNHMLKDASQTFRPPRSTSESPNGPLRKQIEDAQSLDDN